MWAEEGNNKKLNMGATERAQSGKSLPLRSRTHIKRLSVMSALVNAGSEEVGTGDSLELPDQPV